jgi:hypothetical protein
MSEARMWYRLAAHYNSIVRIFDASYSKVHERLARDLLARQFVAKPLARFQEQAHEIIEENAS